MSMTHWFYSLRGFVSLFRRRKGAAPNLSDADLFSRKGAARQPALSGSGFPKQGPKQGWLRRLQSFRWLPLGNQRKRSPWVQTEMLLQEVHPLRHDLGEDDVELVPRPRGKVIFESQPVATVPRQLDTENAYARLRNRAPLSERVISE